MTKDQFTHNNLIVALKRLQNRRIELAAAIDLIAFNPKQVTQYNQLMARLAGVIEACEQIEALTGVTSTTEPITGVTNR